MNFQVGNRGSKTDSWCGSCPKCLFVCLILSPFLNQEELRAIFGRDLLEDLSLKEIFEKLVGIAREKPFECVGSRDEVREAIRLTVEKILREGKPLPALLACYREALGLPVAGQTAGISPYFTYYDEENLLPPELDRLVRESLKRRAEEFKEAYP